MFNTNKINFKSRSSLINYITLHNLNKTLFLFKETKIQIFLFCEVFVDIKNRNQL